MTYTRFEEVKARADAARRGTTIHKGCGGTCAAVGQSRNRYICDDCRKYVTRADVAKPIDLRDHALADIEWLIGHRWVYVTPKELVDETPADTDTDAAKEG